MNMNVKIFTFGCKVNQYSSVLLVNNLIKNNVQVNSNNNPDYIVINMCALTQAAVKKVKKQIKSVKKDFPLTPVILTGCIEDEDKYDVDFIFKIGERNKIYNLFNINTFSEYIYTYPGQTRAFLMIQEGCQNFCSYCIVPYLRNQLYSKPFNIIKKELDELADSGYKEVVLTGTHINKYEYENFKLKDVISLVEQNRKIKRFRISSIEPDGVDEEFIQIIKKSKKFCPHLHLSVQSASDNVLEKMNRNYRISDVEKIIFKLRTLKNFEWSADFITGFPGETIGDFKKTLSFVKKHQPLLLHVFSFSKRKKTKAFGMKETVSKKEKKRRSKILKRAGSFSRNRVIKKYINKKLILLAEKNNTGYTQNYIKLETQKNINSGDFYEIKINDDLSLKEIIKIKKEL
ncbi:MAG: MiaB/RimO family radical SAM methylthiotransferase [Candidatus Muiribacteriota bacterium]